MKGIIGFIMVIAAMYPPCSNARGIHVISPIRVVAPATSVSAAKPDKNAEKAAKKAKKEAEKKARKNKKNKNAIPEGAITSAEALIDSLASLSPYSAEVTYDVALPMSSDEITYSLKLASSATKTDNLCPADYLIEWTLNHNGSDSNGFLAYFNGNHYRYRDHRLQEYHYTENAAPFTGDQGGRVQTNGQFVDLIPQMIAGQLRDISSAPDFTIAFSNDTLSESINCVGLTATQTINDEIGRIYTITADRFSGRPVVISVQYNPGQISEQTVTAKYHYGEEPLLKTVADEEQLQNMYPEIFTKYRDTSNRIEHMRGLPLPSFSLPTVTSTRYTHEKDEPLGKPTVIAIIDPSADNASETVSVLRKALSEADRQAALVLAFTGSNIDKATELTAGTTHDDETVAVSAHSLAQNCGTAVFPTVIVAESSGKISNVLLGFNNNMLRDVIQSLALVY